MFSQNVALDVNFATAGIAHHFPKSDPQCSILTAGQDIISAGYRINAIPVSSYNTVMIKYKPDGSIDTAFGNSGVVEETIGYKDMAYALLQQPEGKIVIAGSYSVENFSTNYGFIARYYVNGTKDNSFGIGGIQKYSPADSPLTVLGAIVSLQLLPNGQFLALSGNSVLIRLNGDGSPDVTFGSNGQLALSNEAFGFSAYHMQLLQDGNILAWGADGTSSDTKLAVVKYHPDGSYFSGFGDNGKMIYNFVTNEHFEFYEMLTHFAEYPDGSLLFSGVAPYQSPMIKLHADGSFDTSFGTGGILEQDVAGYKIVLQPDQKILLGTSEQLEGDTRYLLARLNPDGTLDTSFNTTGYFGLNLSPNGDILRGMLLQSDGNLVVSGFSKFAGLDEFTHFRLLLDQNLSHPGFAAKKELQVFPNPFTKEINFSNENGISGLTLSDLSGKIISEAQPWAENYQLQIELPAGIYMVRITDFAGNTRVKKLIGQ